MKIYYNLTRQCLVDEDNCRIHARPVIYLGEKPSWQIQFYTGNPGESPSRPDISDAAAWRAAVDCDWASNTDPMCRTVTGIDRTAAGDGLLTVPLNANTERFAAALSGKQSLVCFFELRGYDSSGNIIQAVIFNTVCHNAIDPEGSGELEEIDPDTATRTWTDARIAQQLFPEYSADGESWHSTLNSASDLYWRFRHGSNGTPSAAQLIPYGPDGVTPHIGDNGHWFFGDSDTGVAAALTGSYLTFNSVSNNKVTFSGLTTLPAGVLTAAGKYYPVEKDTITIDSVNNAFTFDVSTYLTYDEAASFSGTWTLYMAAGAGADSVRLGPCSGLGFATGSSGPSFSWIDPDNVTLNGAVLAEWNQTVLVRKEVSDPTDYPTGPEDGVIMATTSRTQANKNYYRDHSFTDTTQDSETAYSYMLFSQSSSGAWNNLTANKFTSGIGLSWDMVKIAVRAGLGPMLYPVGTVFYVDHSEYTHQDSTGLWFRVAGHDQVPAADESLTHSMCLEMVDVLFHTQYDAAEYLYALTADTVAQAGKTYYTYSGGTYTALTLGTDYDIGDSVPAASWYEKNDDNRIYGSNNPTQNNLIQWANSSGAANSWFSPQTIWDTCSSTLLGKNGFMRHLDPLFAAVVQPAKLTSAKATPDGGGSMTHSAKFWSLSYSQVTGGTNIDGTMENVRLQYYVNGGSAVKYLKDTQTAAYWWLRSTVIPSGHGIYDITSAGIVGDAAAYSEGYGGVSLACIIA